MGVKYDPAYDHGSVRPLSKEDEARRNELRFHEMMSEMVQTVNGDANVQTAIQKERERERKQAELRKEIRREAGRAVLRKFNPFHRSKKDKEVGDLGDEKQ